MNSKTTAVVFLVSLVLVIISSSNAGAAFENMRLYKSCMIEMQDKPHKEALSICKERTKE